MLLMKNVGKANRNDDPQPNPDDADVRKLNEVDSTLRRNADILRLQTMNSDRP